MMGEKGRTAGKLCLCATPIGNLEDITLRVLDVLRQADVVAAEDTRRTRQLFSRYDIHTPLVSYREENREAAGAKILGRLLGGETVALVSDAGTPGISDPGHHLVGLCIESGIDVESLPGANAAINALVVSGLPTGRFAFEGFLPRKAGARRKALEALSTDERTLLFYESPNRVATTLADIETVMGDRRAAIARELTKKFEEVLRGSVSGLRDELEGREVKGEIVLVVEGAAVVAATSEDEEAAAVEALRLKKSGLSLKEAVRVVTEGSSAGLSRSAVYNKALEHE
jgi:16S rRNA (cytidine1402-2'-O)-methyltransferase